MHIDIVYENPRYSAHIKKLAISTQAKTREKLMQNIQEAVSLYYEEESHYKTKKAEQMRFYLNIVPTHASKLQIA